MLKRTALALVAFGIVAVYLLGLVDLGAGFCIFEPDEQNYSKLAKGTRGRWFPLWIEKPGYGQDFLDKAARAGNLAPLVALSPASPRGKYFWLTG